MNLLVPSDIILMTPIDTEEVLESGLVVTQTRAVKSCASVSAIHPDTAARLGVAVGDTIYFNPFSARELEIGPTDRRLAIHAGDVLAVVKGGNP